MSEITGNSNEAIFNRFERDKKLMRPRGFQTKQDYQFYTEYLHKLVDNPTFVSASRMVENKIEKAKSRKQFKERARSTALYIMIMSLFIGAGAATYNLPSEYGLKQTTGQRIAYLSILAFMTLVGACMCAMMKEADDRHIKNIEKPEVFYNRVIVRYFDVLKKMYPSEMSEKYLQICNQPDMEMARAIYSLLIVNMDEADVNKLNEIALSVNWALYENKITTMRDIENKIHQAIKIIEKTLTAHPELQTVVKDAYAANVPTTFFVVNAQKTPRVR